MTYRLLFTVLALAHLSGFALAQTEGKALSLLSFGRSPAAYSVTEETILRQLAADGWLSESDLGELAERGAIHGERLSVYPMDAGWALDQLPLMLGRALDLEADILVAFTTPVAQAAVNATINMEDPPAVIFASSYFPFAAGLGAAPCLTPDHVTGSQITPPYELLIDLLFKQQPDIQTVGVMFSADQVAGVEGAATATALLEARDIEVKSAAVTHPVDFSAAITGLVSRDVEAVILAIDTLMSTGLSSIVAIATENLVPVYYPSLGGVYNEALISAGYFRQTEQGLNVGRMASAALSGELDISRTAITEIGGDGVGVSLNAAANLELELAPDILELADVTIGSGQFRLSERLLAFMEASVGHFEAEDRRAADRAFLESLHCSDQMIAEQQATLDAQSS